METLELQIQINSTLQRTLIENIKTKKRNFFDLFKNDFL